MARPTLQTLEQELVAKGYSRRYARRLIDELADHWIQDQSTRDEDATGFEAKMGSVESIVGAVHSHRTLDPIPQRYPTVVFLILPTIIVTLATMLIVNGLHGWIPNQDHGQKHLLAGCWKYFEMFTMIGFPCVAAYLVQRFQAPIKFLFLNCMLLSLFGLFWTSVATCSQSGSTFVHTRWEFNWYRFLLPWLSFALLTANQMRLGRFGFDRLSFPCLSLRINCLDSGTLLATGYCATLFAIFGFTVTHTLQGLRKHPVDNLVAGFNQPSAHAFRYLQAAREFMDQSTTSPFSTEQLQIVEHFETDTSQLFSGAASSKPAENQSRQSTFQKIAIDAQSDLQSKLSPQQHEEIEKLVIRQMGWQAFFLESTRDHVSLSAYQFQEFKDVYLEFLKKHQRLMAAWRKVDPDQKSELATEFNEFNRNRNQKLASILNQRQRKLFDRYRGSRMVQLKTKLASRSLQATNAQSGSNSGD